MYFVTYRRDGRHRLGVLDRPGGRIVDAEAAANALGERANAPADMLEVIRLGDEALAWARRVSSCAEELGAGSDPLAVVAEADAELAAPLPRPAKNVFAIGLNYVRHTAEFTGSDRLPEHPIVFTKASSSVVGPETPIVLRPDLSEQIDYEGELAVVIGKAGHDIPPERAEEHVFGYTIVNDVTARDLQKRTSQWFLGKSLDSFCPMGPYLVHKSAVGWPVRLDLQTRVNGEPRQASNTELLYFDLPTLIATLSAGITLELGDVIATGTPEGVGMGYDPPRYLRTGDVVEIEIEKLGLLRNPVT